MVGREVEEACPCKGKRVQNTPALYCTALQLSESDHLMEEKEGRRNCMYISEYAQDTKGGSGGQESDRYEGLVDAREVTPDSHQSKPEDS